MSDLDGAFIVDPGCWCETCHDATIEDCVRCHRGIFRGHFIACPTCGNKRCPHATNHENACTGSNESGQPGSSCR